MARGGIIKLPKKLYYVKEPGEYGLHFGPYTKKPTAMCDSNNGDIIITWVQDNDGNFIIQSLKNIRKAKLKKLNGN